MEKSSNLENMSFIKNSVAEFSEERHKLKEELKEIEKPINSLKFKLDSAKTNKEYDAIVKDIEVLWTENNGALAKKVEAIQEKIHTCNTEIMLRDRKDMVEHYMIITSSINDAYELLSDLPEDSQEAEKLEALLVELEQGLQSAISRMRAEGVGKKDVEEYRERYRNSESAK